MDTSLWWVAAPGGVVGPAGAAQVLEMVRTGQATPASLVCRVGHTEWVALGRDPELALVLAQVQRGAPGRVETPPPPPGEPWFYNVAPGRALLLDVVSVGSYALVWAYRHRSWLERRRGALTSPLWQFRADKWLPVEIASAAQRVGVAHRVTIDLQPINDALLVLSALCCCLLPITLGIGVHRFIQMQNAAEIVNQAVAPGAPRPPMDVGEWLSVLVGLGIWIGLPLLFALNVLLEAAG
jgi:GYF domain 2